MVDRPDAHDLVDPLSAAVGVDRPHAHDVVDPLSAAVGVDGTLVVVLCGSVWICVCGCAAWMWWCTEGSRCIGSTGSIVCNSRSRQATCLLCT